MIGAGAASAGVDADVATASGADAATTNEATPSLIRVEFMIPLLWTVSLPVIPCS